MKTFDITGSKGGKGGGGKTFHEDDNTLQTFQTVRSLYAISEGQIGGLVAGAKSIYVNDIALQNSDGSYNFGGKVAWDERQGLPSQPYMKGFPSASSEFAVGVQVKVTTPLSRTTSASNIDQMRVTIGLPNGLYEQKTSENALTGSQVSLKIEKKLTSSGSWLYDRTVTIDGKTTSTYAQAELIDRPPGTGTWDVRLTPITPDSTAATLKNDTYWNTYTEIQNVQLEYDNTAYIGCGISAQDLGNQSIPTVSFEVFGLYVRVPTNYDPVTCAYTGVWDGTFKMAWTDNPAWHLYDLLTHPRYGLGYRITDQRVDKYSFYSAAVYNDGLVSDGNGGQERRFTCNVPIQSRTDALQVCSDLASNMHAKIVWMGNRVVLIQDRPTSSTRILSPADVIDGKFDYPTTTLDERYTAANITWNNPSDSYLQKIENISAGSETGAFQTALTAAQNQYGYNVTEVSAFGCTRQSQARRHGRWLLDSVLNLTDLVKFQMSANGFSLQVGEVVTIHDPTIAGSQLGGRTAAGSTTTVIQLDRPVTLTAGSTISLQLPTGLETQNITATTGTVTSVTVSSVFSAAPTQYTSFLVTTTIAPRQFKLDKITQSAPGVIDIQGLLYDPNKWTRIESNIALPTPVFSAFTAGNPTTACTSMTFLQNAQLVDGYVRRSLHVGWTPPTSGVVAKYEILYRQASDVWQTAESTTNSVELTNVVNGLVEVKVYAVNPVGIQSPELYGSYTINIAGGSGSALDVPGPVTEQYSGSTSQFTGADVNVKWTNPSTNAGRSISLKDFVVQVVNPTTSTVIRTEYVDAVAPSSYAYYSYTLAKNTADNAIPLRSVQINVACRDANNQTTAFTTVTLTNPAPAVPTAITVSGGFSTNFLKWTTPTDADLQGVYVWASKTSGFSPSAATLIETSKGSTFAHSGLNNGETWYYRIGAYDLFSTSTSGTGLNVSSEFTATTLQPANPNEWQLSGITWKPNDPSANSVSWTAGTAIQTMGTGSGGTTTISAGNAAWTSGVLYVYYQSGNSALQATTNITSAVGTDRVIVATYRGGTQLEFGDGKAYMDGGLILAGTVGASQLVTGTAVITQGAQIANATIGDAQVNTLTGSKITAGTITADRITANSLTSSQIAAGGITADRIDSRGLSIKDASGNVILASGIPLAYSNVSGGPPSNATNGATFGVNIGGQITSGNASTYIASGAIGNAQIGTAAIGSANIQDLTIGSGKIANNSLSTTASAASGASSVSITVGIPSNCASLTILAFFGYATVTRTGTDAKGTWSYSDTEPVDGTIQGYGTTLNGGYGSTGWSGVNPGAGTQTFTATRSAVGGAITITVIMTYK